MRTFELGPVDIIDYDGLDYREAVSIINQHCTHRFKRVRITNGEFVFYRLRRLKSHLKTDCNIVYLNDVNNPGFDEFIETLLAGERVKISFENVRRDIPACETKRWIKHLFKKDRSFEITNDDKSVFIRRR
jgi:hypothetical protein